MTHFSKSSYYYFEMLIIQSPSKYTDLEHQIKTTATNDKAICCKRMSFGNRKRIHTVKSTPRGFSSVKTAIRGSKFQITWVYFLSIILTNNMYLYDYSSEKNQAYHEMKTDRRKAEEECQLHKKMRTFQSH